MKKSLMKQLIPAFLCLILLLTGSCKSQTESPKQSGEPVTTEPATDDAADTLVLAKDGASGYVIVYDEADSGARSLAGDIWETLFRATGARLPIVSTADKSDRAQKEIVICNADGAVQTMTEGIRNDFLIAAKAQKLFLWADSEEMKTYLSMYLKKDFLKYVDSTTVSVPANLNCRYSDGSSGASYLRVLDSGKCGSVVVYDGDDAEVTAYAKSFVTRLSSECGISVTMKNLRNADKVYAHEILFGSARDYAGELVSRMDRTDDFLVGAAGGHLVCHATDSDSWNYLLEYLISDYFKNNNGTLIVDCNEPFIRKQSKLAEMSYVAYYQSIHHTYSSRVDEFRDQKLKDADAQDCELIDALIERMGSGFAVYPGSSSALYKSYIVKLDRSDYSKVTKLQNGELLIAADFARDYFGSGVTSDAEGYVNLSAYLKGNSRYHLSHDGATDVWTVTPQEVAAFPSAEKLGGYSDAAYLARMKKFFVNKYAPEPGVNTEQSRVVLIQDTEQDVTKVPDWSVAKYKSYYDPTVLSVSENGKTVLYAIYGKREWNDGRFTGTGSDLLVSRDGGKTWTLACSFPKISASFSLLESDGMIYAICGFASLQVGRYDPATGNTAYADHQLALGKSGPGTLLIHNDRIYRPYGEAVVSASVHANLLLASSWTLSNPVSGLATESYFRSVGLNGHGWKADDGTYVDWEEGNVVPGKDGRLYVIYRQNITNRCALIFGLSEDGRTLSYVDTVNGVRLQKKSFISIPSAKTRHAIRYDENTGLYISLMNIYTGDAETAYSWADAQQRSVLGLVVSKDLVNWETVETLLVDRKMMNPVLSVFAHGFQYVDFTIADGNIYFVVRENSGEKTVNYHHEANCVTFYTIENYRSVLQKHGL